MFPFDSKKMIPLKMRGFLLLPSFLHFFMVHITKSGPESSAAFRNAVLISIPSVEDSTLAPDGCGTLFGIIDGWVGGAAIVTPRKTNMAGWKITMFTRRYIFKWLFFSIVMLVFPGSNPLENNLFFRFVTIRPSHALYKQMGVEEVRGKQIVFFVFSR